MQRTVVVCGVGDVGSAVAYDLHTTGYRVVLQDHPTPTYPRRGMAFVDAIFEGTAQLAGIIAKRARDEEAVAHMLKCRRAIPIMVGDLTAVLKAIRPDVLVDASMRKRAFPLPQIGFAPLTIGLGPNFTVGKTTDLAVETAWGDDLGRVVTQGSTQRHTGEPRYLGSYGRERFVYAPQAGIFRTNREIGERVSSGERVADVGGLDLHSPLEGCIRGLTHDGVMVEKNTKVFEVDPTGDKSAAFGLGMRPRGIAEGVLRALDATKN